jgi:LCP family protein required for cell wall assembly
MGVDLRKPGRPWRTDTIILVSIDRWNRTVSLLSIPRDLWVYMPGVGYGRINTADFWGEYKKLKGGGPELLKQTIKHNLGIEVHRYARVDFKGFILIIDTLGGITVDVDCAIRDPKTGFEIEPGVQLMDGKTALKYVQSRYTTSDFDRARRQQKVLRAIFEKVLSLNLLPNIPHLWQAITETVKTDLSLVEVITLAYFGARLKPEHLRTRVLGYPAVRSWLGPGGAQVLLLNEEKFQKVRQDFLHPPDALAEDQEREEATVEVLNGTEDETLTELAVAYLKHRGFDAFAGGPADRRNHRATAIILVNPEKTATAGRLAQALGVDPKNITIFRDPTTTADVRVILGKNYRPCRR